MFSKRSNIWLSTHIPEFDLSIFTARHQEHIVFWFGDCGDGWEMTLQLEDFALVVEVPNVYSSASGARVEFFRINVVAKRKQARLGLLAGEGKLRFSVL